MSNNFSNQNATAGKDVTQVGRDYKNSTRITFFSFFIFGILALGGLALMINNGLTNHSENAQSQSSPPSAQTSPK